MYALDNSFILWKSPTDSNQSNELKTIATLILGENEGFQEGKKLLISFISMKACRCMIIMWMLLIHDGAMTLKESLEKVQCNT